MFINLKTIMWELSALQDSNQFSLWDGQSDLDKPMSCFALRNPAGSDISLLRHPFGGTTIMLEHNQLSEKETYFL